MRDSRATLSIGRLDAKDQALDALHEPRRKELVHWTGVAPLISVVTFDEGVARCPSSRTTRAMYGTLIR